MRLLLSLLFLLPLSAHALSADAELQRELDTLVPMLDRDLEDIDADASEAMLQAQEEFFPDDGTETGDRGEIEGSDEFVTFRLDGVPYALKDVALIQWFAPYVREMTERGIVTGYRDVYGRPTGIFGPGRDVSLEELAKMSVQASGIDQSVCPPVPLNTAAQKSWSASFISCAEQYGFVVYADVTLDIRRPATRAEVVMTVLQAFGVQIRELGAEEKIFTDVNPSILFSGAIKTAVGDGIVSGYQLPDGTSTGTFGPAKNINRAEVSKILSIALQVYGS
jgi:hypothetical protein